MFIFLCLPCHLAESDDEGVEFFGKGEDVWRDAAALHVACGEIDRDCIDSMLVEEGLCHLGRGHAFYADVRNGAETCGVGGRIDDDVRNVAHLCRPVLLQVAEPGFFAFGAERVVKVEGVVYGEIGVDWNGSGVIEPGDPFGALAFGEEGPDLGLFFLLYIENTCAEGNAEPFVEAGAIVITTELGDGMLDVREAVRPVDHDFDAVGVGHVGDLSYG